MKKYQIIFTFILFFIVIVLWKQTATKIWQTSHTTDDNVDMIKFKKISPAVEYLFRFYDKIDDLPTIYIITPTYTRETQLADLMSLRNVLMLVPNILWILIEDSGNLTKKLTNFLNTSKLPYIQLCTLTPSYNSSGVKDMRIRGVIQRNTALRWLKDNQDILKHGVVYFADDDNRYDLRLFEEMRWTLKVSVWPVGLVAQMYYERPVCKDGKVIGFFSWIKRPFAIDMAGFAINLHHLLSFPDVKFLPTKGRIETNFLQQLVTMNDLEPKADNCTKIYVWHTKTAPLLYFLEKKFLFYKHNMTYDLEIVENV